MPEKGSRIIDALMTERVLLCLELETVAIDSFRPLRDSVTQRGIFFRSVSGEQQLHPDTWLTRFAEIGHAARGSVYYRGDCQACL